jgi:prepilin-type N-terminal cleavage/methylation domain-containing protein
MRDQRGMTMLELTIGIVIAGIVLAASTPALRSMLGGYQHRNSVTEISSRMFLTRQMAVREKRPYVVRIDDAAMEFLVFEDADGDGVLDGGERTLGPYALAEGISLQNVDWADDQLTFFPNGAASQTGDLRVVDGRGRTKTIRVSSITGNTEVLP